MATIERFILESLPVYKCYFSGYQDGAPAARTIQFLIDNPVLQQELEDKGLSLKYSQPMEEKKWIELQEKLGAMDRANPAAYSEYVAGYQSKIRLQGKLAGEGQYPKEFIKIYIKDDDSGQVTVINNESDSELAMLDRLWNATCDVKFSLYEWTYRNKVGRTAYINSIVFHIQGKPSVSDEDFYNQYVSPTVDTPDIPDEDIPF